MNIRSLDAYAKAATDWSPYNECFGGRIRMSDIDGHVEHGWQYLYVESKPARGFLSRGQELSLTRRTEDGISTSLVLFGGDSPVEYQVARSGRLGGRKQCNVDSIREFMSGWYQSTTSDSAANRARLVRLIGSVPDKDVQAISNLVVRYLRQGAA